MTMLTYYSCCGCQALALLVIGIFCKVASVETLPTVTIEPWVDINQATTLTCLPSQGTLRALRWRKYSLSEQSCDYSLSCLNIMRLELGTVIWGSDQNRYSFDETQSDYPLTIKSVTLADERYYSCYTNVAGEGPYPSNSTAMRVRVPPSSLAITYYGASYSDGVSFPVVAGNNHSFSCTTPGVKPATKFTWILSAGITTDELGGSQTNTPNSDDSRLTDSTNTITVNIAGTPATAQLTCGATNRQDGSNIADGSITVNLQVRGRPDEPTGVVITERTAESLTVGWTPGYDGGEEQSFRVSYFKSSDPSTEVFSEEIPIGGNTTSTATGLDDYTEYEIRVYAKNAIGESFGYGNTTGYTLPYPPGPGSGITVKYDEQGGTVEVGGLKEGNGCIQLEVQYQGNGTWQECGACISSNQTVTLSEWCASSQKQRRRAVGDIEAVRSKKCFSDLCSEPAAAEIVKPTDATPRGPDIGLIVGATVGGVALLAIVVVYLVKRKNGKEGSFSLQEVELQEPSRDVQPKENNGITNQALQNNDTYAQVNKIKLPPKPQSARSASTNLPDVTYAEVYKDKKPKPPHDDYAAKKKPKK